MHLETTMKTTHTAKGMGEGSGFRVQGSGTEPTACFPRSSRHHVITSSRLAALAVAVMCAGTAIGDSWPTYQHDNQRSGRNMEPLVVGDEDCALWDMVEDELILGLPAFSYHDTEDCKETLAEFSAPPAAEGEVGERSNPFNVLAQLKPGDNSRS